MKIEDRLREDLYQAMRDGDTVRKSSIRMLRAAIVVERKAGEQQQDLTEEEVQAVIAKQVRQRRESIAVFTEAGRSDLAEKEVQELQILLEYLPKQMTREELISAAQEAIARIQATGPGQIGAVMRELMPKVKGRADGRIGNQVVRELLAP